jgi:two-component system sensor histidine kinase BaeS
VRIVSAREFADLAVSNAERNFSNQAEIFYQANGTWRGFAEFLARRQVQQSPPKPVPGGQTGNLPIMQPLTFALADADGRIVVPTGGYRRSELISEVTLAGGTPLEIDDQFVGTVLTTGNPPPLDPREEQYLQRTDRVLLFAALGSLAVALILSLILTRGLTRPVRELTQATRSLAKGKLGQQVPVRSADEIGELTAAFNQMSADLYRANEQRRRMTADIAHDLRTPLTILGGYLEAMQDGVLPPTPKRLETMNTEIQGLIRLVEDLRMLSLADAGNLLLNRQFIEPLSLLERAATAFAQKAAEKFVEIQVDAQPDLPQISVDPERIHQVLGNLVANALRYTPEGGVVSLQCSVISDQSVLRQLSTDNCLLITVQDTGKGIPAEALPHIFERFYRGESAREGGESGLGLAIAKSIVEAHGGQISVSSAGAGKGSMFSIWLPM